MRHQGRSLIARTREKLRHITEMRSHSRSWELVLDSLRLQSRPYVVELAEGLSFELNPREGDWFSLYECAIRRDYLSGGIVLKEGDTVIDIGANFGAFAIVASRLAGHVHAFEPSPATFERLTRNLRLNGCTNVTAYPEAVSGTGGDAQIFLHGKSAYNSILPNVDGRGESGETAKVHIRGISEVLEVVPGRISLLKIDCEGAEYDIFARIPPERLEQVDQIALELHDVDGRYDLRDHLARCGFRVAGNNPITAIR